MEPHEPDANNDDLLKNQVRTLINLHKTFQVENKLFAKLTSNVQHILLIYENNNDLDIYIKQYINEGLKWWELCIHATVNLMSENYIKNFASGIEDYRKNREECNLIMLNMQPYYKKAVEGDLKLFDKFAKQILSRIGKDCNGGLPKKVRITIDCASQLIKNGYFDQFAALETW
ncbi:MAG: hypothetical protein P0116_09190 [Candidatus Nitrosocosmicus sp.]|nr:hypothetical protein [Candidatus Nitrosocosmicus sp.]